MLTSTSDTPQDIPFASFVSYLETIASRRPREANRNNRESDTSSDKAADDFREWANKLKWPVPPKTGAIIFRLLFPDQDIRRKYNLQETQLGKHLAQVLEVSTGRGKRGEGLIRWNSNREDNNGVEIGRDGCLGLEVAKIRADTEFLDNSTDLKLADVDRLLDELAAHSKWSNLGETTYEEPGRRPVEVLKDLYRTLSARQSAFVTQIILKDLRPLLYPLPSVSTYKSLMNYNSLAFHEIVPYSMMKAWHWAMPRIYRTKADFDRAANLCEQIPRDLDQVTSKQEVEQLVKMLSKPELGTPVNIPKAIKASGPCLAATLAKLTGEVWAETKMDGERMQIHIDTSKSENRQIQVFSKSHRDSTRERASTQVAIRAALGLPGSFKSTFISSHPRPDNLSRITSGIFEAEMVAWDMRRGKVDEFWRISELKCKPWQTVKDVDINTQQEEELFTQEASGSEQSPTNTQETSKLRCRHLAVCFFDVLYLNDESLVDVKYSKRREILENCVHVIPSYCMLVDRKQFDFNHPNGRTHLREYYAEMIAERYEGLMLKTADSVYNDWRMEHRWFKVKKDYIDGLGDTADYAVIGAGWDKDRGRELRVSTATYIVWYIGLCTNTRDVKINPSTRPDFKIVFKSLSYGLTRPQLEKVNQMARDMGRPPLEARRRHWLFTYQVAPGLEKPTIIFKEPFVFELMGSGFTKQSRKHEYELRWPRITKVHDLHERDWTSAIDLETHNEIARRAIEPEILRASDMISGGDEERAENGFKAELDLWNRRLLETDSKWETRHPRPRLPAASSKTPSSRTIPSTLSRSQATGTSQALTQKVPGQSVSSASNTAASATNKESSTVAGRQRLELSGTEPRDPVSLNTHGSGLQSTLYKSKGKSSEKQTILEDHAVSHAADDGDGSSPPLDLPTDDLPPLTTDAYKIKFKKSSTRSLSRDGSHSMPSKKTSAPSPKSSRTVASSSVLPPVSVSRDTLEGQLDFGKASATRRSRPHVQSPPLARISSSEPITISSSPPPSDSKSTRTKPTTPSSSVIPKKKQATTKDISASKPPLPVRFATPGFQAPASIFSTAPRSTSSAISQSMPKAPTLSSSVIRKKKQATTKDISASDPSLPVRFATPGFQAPVSTSSTAPRSTSSAIFRSMPKAPPKQAIVEAPKTSKHIGPSTPHQGGDPKARSAVPQEAEGSAQAAKRAADTQPTKHVPLAANQVVLPLKSSMKRKRPESSRGSTDVDNDLAAPTPKRKVKFVTFQQVEAAEEVTERIAPTEDTEMAEPTAPSVDTESAEPTVKRPRLSESSSSSKGKGKATDPVSDTVTNDQPKQLPINLEPTLPPVDPADSAPKPPSPKPPQTNLRGGIEAGSVGGNQSTSTGLEQAGSSTVTDNLLVTSAAPWRQGNDVRWCLVRDPLDYGISGTRYHTVTDLLQSVKIGHKMYCSDPETARVCYIFIENPIETTLKRIQKQILFRALSDPNVTIVGYNSKVLELWEGNQKTWKEYELFRFNSYDEDYDIQQAILSQAGQNQ